MPIYNFYQSKKKKKKQFKEISKHEFETLKEWQVEKKI